MFKLLWFSLLLIKCNISICQIPRSAMLNMVAIQTNTWPWRLMYWRKNIIFSWILLNSKLKCWKNKQIVQHRTGQIYTKGAVFFFLVAFSLGLVLVATFSYYNLLSVHFKIITWCNIMLTLIIRSTCKAL